jgi:hypothetical protein
LENGAAGGVRYTDSRMNVPAADLVWNRACDGGGPNPRTGDAALAALLLCHGYAMNGGVFHAVEGLDEMELRKAADGYRFFGLEAVSALFDRAAQTPNADRGGLEREFDLEYGRLANDSLLTERFCKRFKAHPELFAPLE